jgi:uncharacterized protein
VNLADAFRPVRTTDLPIFRGDVEDPARRDRYSIFYTPGVLCVVPLPLAHRFESALGAAPGDPVWRGLSREEIRWRAELREKAQGAVAQVEGQRREPFEPECLTLYLNVACNLRCVYCYANPSPESGRPLDLKAIAAAAEMVASNCQRKGLPFTAVFHGGGEPTLDRGHADRVLALLSEVAEDSNLETFYYIATNGVMSEKKAHWLARSFDLIGLSCDGPADIQDLQRPRHDGRGTSQIVERTAYILREEGRPFHVRTTITPGTMHRQAEITEYLCQQISPDEIHFEAVYAGGRAGQGNGWHPEQAEAFVNQLFAAQMVARRFGIHLSNSGSRLDTVHGPHCNVFRQTLNLVPPGEAALRPALMPSMGKATACFKLADTRRLEEMGACIGGSDRQGGYFELDGERIRWLRERLSALPARCAHCFNRFHCARDCPDGCPLDGGTSSGEDEVPGFRCRMQRGMTAAILMEAAESLWREPEAGRREEPRGTAIP